jgi:hypothetical protein
VRSSVVANCIYLEAVQAVNSSRDSLSKLPDDDPVAALLVESNTGMSILVGRIKPRSTGANRSVKK